MSGGCYPLCPAAAGSCVSHQSAIKRRTAYVLITFAPIVGRIQTRWKAVTTFHVSRESTQVERHRRSSGAQPQEVCPCPHLGSAACLTVLAFFHWLRRAVVLSPCGRARSPEHRYRISGLEGVCCRQSRYRLPTVRGDSVCSIIVMAKMNLSLLWRFYRQIKGNSEFNY